MQALCAVFFILAAFTSCAAADSHDCILNGQTYANFEYLDHDNGCARLQCQFGKLVTFHEACGKEVDGNCHRLNFMFLYEGNTYQCQKVLEDGQVVYRNKIAIPRLENCTVKGRIYQNLDKFKLGDSCRERQCQNGVVVLLDPVCGTEVDGKCHRVGEYFDNDGTVYKCTSREVSGEVVFENQVLEPQPGGTMGCETSKATYENYAIFTIPPLCHVRQCYNRSVNVITRACAFKRDVITCRQEGEQWAYGDRTYVCTFNETSQLMESEILTTGFGSCNRAERWYKHLEIEVRPGGCTFVQCQDGITPPVEEGCLWNFDNTCHELNSIWPNEDGVALKCIRTDDGQYIVVKLDENGTVIANLVPEEPKPQFDEHCPDFAADIIIVLDCSASIVHRNFLYLLNFTSILLTAFTIGPQNVRVGAVSFSDNARKDFDLITYNDYDSISKAIKQIPFEGDTTETHKAFNLIVDENMFGPEHGGRPGVPNIVMIITDGNSTNPILMREASDRLKALGTEIIVVGVKNVSNGELHVMASSPANVFNVSSYEEIFSLIKKLANRTCEVIINSTEVTTVPPETSPATTPASTPTTTPETTPSTTPENQPCTEADFADVVYVIDSSDSITEENYNKSLQFFARLTNLLPIGKHAVQIAAIVYSWGVLELFDFDDDQDKKLIEQALLSAPHLKQSTHTHKALTHVADLFDVKRGARRNARKIVIVKTDGKSAYPDQTKKRANMLKDQQVQIFSIGVGKKIDRNELRSIASDENSVFYVPSNAALQQIVAKVARRTCEESHITTPASETPTPEPANETPKPEPANETPKPEPGCFMPKEEKTPGPEVPEPPAPETPKTETPTTETPTPETPTTESVQPCTEHPFADIIFVMDSSDSIAPNDYKKSLTFLADVVDYFPIGEDAILVGAIIYSWDVVPLLYLNNSLDKQQIRQAILAAPHLKQSTLTHKALNFVVNQSLFDATHGGRENAKKIVVLKTDGKSYKKELTIKFANVLKSEGIIIIAIAAGNKIDKSELKAVASDENSVFFAPSNKVLKYIEETVARFTCKVSTSTG